MLHVESTKLFVDKLRTASYIWLQDIFREESPMPKRRIRKPTEAELAILRVLWDRGPSTVRDVQQALHAERGTGYTTALKLLQIMTEKGLVRRNDSERTHVYEAACSQEQTQRQLVGDLPLRLLLRARCYIDVRALG